MSRLRNKLAGNKKASYSEYLKKKRGSRKKVAAYASLDEALKNAKVISIDETGRVQNEEPLTHDITLQVDYDLSKLDYGTLYDAAEANKKELAKLFKDRVIELTISDSYEVERYAYEQELSKEEAIQSIKDYYNDPEFPDHFEDVTVESPNTFVISGV